MAPAAQQFETRDLEEVTSTRKLAGRYYTPDALDKSCDKQTRLPRVGKEKPREGKYPPWVEIVSVGFSVRQLQAQLYGAAPTVEEILV